MFTQMVALLALRYKNVGTDTVNTVDIFMSILSNSGMERTFLIAPIYYIYSYLLYSIFPFEQTIIIFNACITLVCIFYFINIFSDDIFMSLYSFIALGFFFQCFNISRQYLALSIILLSFSLVYSGKIKLGIIFAFIACGMHITAIVALPLLPLFHYKKISHRKLFILLTTMFILSICSRFLINYLLSVLLLFYPSYKMYIFDTNTISFGSEGQGRFIWLLLFYFLVLILSIVLSLTIKNKKLVDKIKLFSIPVAASIFVGLMGIKNPLFARISVYFSVFLICLIPACIKAFVTKSRIIFYEVFLVVLVVPFYLTILFNHGDVLPYRFFFWLY